MAWARVQSKSGTGSTTTTVTVTLASTPTTGNKILVAFTYSSATATITSVRDGNSNNLTQAIAPVVQASHGTRAFYFYDVPATPSTAFTLVISGANDVGMIVQEISGLATGNTTAAAVDGTAGGLSGTASPTGSPTYSSSALNEFLVSYFGDDGVLASVTVPTGYTADANNINGSGVENTLLGYRNSTNGAEASSWSYTGTSNWSVITLAFKLSGGGGATPTPQQTFVTRTARNRASSW